RRGPGPTVCVGGRRPGRGRDSSGQTGRAVRGTACDRVGSEGQRPRYRQRPAARATWLQGQTDGTGDSPRRAHAHGARLANDAGASRDPKRCLYLAGDSTSWVRGRDAMNFARFFIDRPVFAMVLSIVTVIAGGLAIRALPIAQYPEIAPPTVTVSTNFPGANAKTVAETVATPIEQQVNGVEKMLYMSSQSNNDGSMRLTVTFAVGTNLDIAQVQVQNRVSIAQPILPAEVQRQGITVKKASPDFTLV